MDHPDVGKRVELVSTSDQYTSLRPGDRGTIFMVDDIGTRHVNWDNGSTLGLVPKEDSWKVVPISCHKLIRFDRNRRKYICCDCTEEWDHCPTGYKCSDTPGIFERS